MCTLTYRLTSKGYQLFFNRDEQVTRPQAIPPVFDPLLESVYPVDPTGGGTWIAVHQSGVSLALLNYYQAQVDSTIKSFTSRGVIIPLLLANQEHIHQQLLNMDLSTFQAFQLCVFNKNLSTAADKNELATQYIWDGITLNFATLSEKKSLPITSSAVDYETVYAYRKQQFNQMLLSKREPKQVAYAETNPVTKEDYIRYHQHQGASGTCSVQMARKDAQTVSFTVISVNQEHALGHKVNVEYVDYLNQHTQTPLLLTI